LTSALPGELRQSMPYSRAVRHCRHLQCFAVEEIARLEFPFILGALLASFSLVILITFRKQVTEVLGYNGFSYVNSSTATGVGMPDN
jgi:hypothetical protein